MLRFLSFFALSMVAFQVLFFALVVESAPFDGYLRGLALTAGALLAWTGADVLVVGNQIDLAGSLVAVSAPCSGLQPAAMFAISVLAFPSSLRAKGWGLAAGVPALLALNLLRVLALSVTAAAAPGWFELLHVYVWPMAFVLASIALWVLWARRVVTP